MRLSAGTDANSIFILYGTFQVLCCSLNIGEEDTCRNDSFRMKLINKYLPDYDFHETHAVLVNAAPETCYRETLDLDLSRSWVIKALFRLRGLPVSAQKLSAFTDKMDFALLEEDRFSEFIFGFAVTKNGVERITDATAFTQSRASWRHKVVWNFEFEPESGQTKVLTTTRIKSTTRKDRFRFAAYWFFIGPFSGLIRRISLRMLRKSAEAAGN